ncbi:unnamed protein product [Debaryomyces fabryi]|nr:unnamed protein product [Debaryomyces fabryi]
MFVLYIFSLLLATLVAYPFSSNLDYGYARLDLSSIDVVIINSIGQARPYYEIHDDPNNWNCTLIMSMEGQAQSVITGMDISTETGYENMFECVLNYANIDLEYIESIADQVNSITTPTTNDIMEN